MCTRALQLVKCTRALADSIIRSFFLPPPLPASDPSCPSPPSFLCFDLFSIFQTHTLPIHPTPLLHLPPPPPTPPDLASLMSDATFHLPSVQTKLIHPTVIFVHHSSLDERGEVINISLWKCCGAHTGGMTSKRTGSCTLNLVEDTDS